jgi:hypothetical protein
MIGATFSVRGQNLYMEKKMLTKKFVNRTRFMSIVLVCAFGIAACSGANAQQVEVIEDLGSEPVLDLKQEENQPRSGEMGDRMEDEVIPEEEMDLDDLYPGVNDGEKEESMSEKSSGTVDESMVNTPEFFKATLIDPSTGKQYSINDFAGKVVLLETMAMWCSNCFKQQNEVIELHALLGERDDFISVGLDVDPNENVDDLKAYVESNGFSWTFAVAPVEVAREIGQLYGAQFLNPSATPMLIIDKQGAVHPLPFGIKSSEQLKEALDVYLN